MALLHDYIYRFQIDRMHMASRCRVRIYQAEKGGHTVLLTELNQNPGESIASACDHIATDLAARWQFEPKTTRWLFEDSTLEMPSLHIDEVTFTWDGKRTATAPQWLAASDDQVHAWIGVPRTALERRIGDPGSEIKGV